jgi:hypothetical protein
MHSDLIATDCILGIISLNLDEAAVRAQKKMVRRLGVIEAHYLIAALIDSRMMIVTLARLSGLLLVNLGRCLPGSVRGDQSETDKDDCEQQVIVFHDLISLDSPQSHRGTKIHKGSLRATFCLSVFVATTIE